MQESLSQARSNHQDRNHGILISSVALSRQNINGLMTDVDVSSVLRSWTKSQEGEKACFWRYIGGSPSPRDFNGHLDYEKIRNNRPSKDSIKTVVILSYENPKGASGGVRAVTDRLPAEIRNYLNEHKGSHRFNPEVVRISPRHTGLDTKYDPKELTLLGQCRVPFCGNYVETTIYSVNIKGENWILFEAPGYFAADGGLGGTDPYIYSYENQSDRDGDKSRLLMDSLFGSRAIPEILIKLGLTKDVIVHAQDWEFATTALTIKERIIEDRIESAAVLLTIHNPYDHGLSESTLSLITDRFHSYQWPMIGGQGRPTVLTRMIPLLDGAPSVVSHSFAQDLTRNPQQTGNFTGHQQGVFKSQGLVGIDNGNFISIDKNPFSEEAVSNARKGDPQLIIKEKLVLRKAMLVALQEYLDELRNKPDPKRPVYGRLSGKTQSEPFVNLPDDVPVFMLPGRLDPGQKGYDVVARAIESVPAGYGRFILTPMSPLAKDPAVKPFMDDLIDLAKSRDGEIVILAHRMGKGYMETLAGSTWSLWPSLYEPFGGANEFYAMGTPVIAHAVGGLVQQVIGFHQDPDNATGFLYKEAEIIGESYQEKEAQYHTAHTAGPRERMHVGTYQRQVISLAVTMAEAVSLWKLRPDLYGKILANLYEMYKELSWKKPVEDYLKWYESSLT